jgi:hypothetical protein
LLSELDAAEALELCDALDEHAFDVIGAPTLLAYQCTLQALEQSTSVDADLKVVVDQTACETARSACLSGSARAVHRL